MIFVGVIGDIRNRSNQNAELEMILEDIDLNDTDQKQIAVNRLFY